MKHLIASIITAAFAVAPALAHARPISEFEATLNLAPRVEDRSIIHDLERVHPYVSPDGVKNQKEAVDNIRGRNLAANQEHCKNVRRNITRTSSERCVYSSPWLTGPK